MLSPLCRTRAGAALAGLATVLPILALGLATTPNWPPLDSWEQILGVVAIAAFAVVGAISVRRFITGFTTLDSALRDDRPQN